jgi:hypothetical protein
VLCAVLCAVLCCAGAILFENAAKVNWTDVRESVPIFLVTALVPFTNSLFYGVLCGLCMHIVFRVCSAGFWRKHAPPGLLALAARCCACCCCCAADKDRPLTDDDDNITQPLFFDNPYFDFEPRKDSTGAISDYGSDDSFFDIGMPLGGLSQAAQRDSKGGYLDIDGDDASELGGVEDSYLGGAAPGAGRRR